VAEGYADTKESGYVAIANQHPVLARAFADTQWCGDWRLALAQLPGAMPSKRMLNFGCGVMAKAVMLPRRIVLEVRHSSAVRGN
jgi:hypothetical protein